MVDRAPQVLGHAPPPIFHGPPTISGGQYTHPAGATVQTQKETQERKPAKQENPSHTCYINHINEKIKPLQLKSMLYDSFCKFGEILDVSVKKSLKTRGQGWVTFSTVDSATKAVEALDQTYFLGKTSDGERPVQVNFSRNKAHVLAKMDGTFVQRNVHAGSHKKRKRGATEDAVTKHDGNGRVKKMTREQLPAHSTLLLQNIETEVSQETLESMFSSQKGLKKIRYIPMRHVAFVDFVDVDSAVDALKKIDKSGHALDINFAKQ